MVIKKTLYKKKSHQDVAALTLRTVAMRNWSIWNAQERQSWFEKMNALLENVRVFEMENFVVAQLYRTYAVGWKRQWMDVQDPMRTILQQVQKLEEMGKKQGTGMKIMAALLAEFAAGTASPLMMPVHFFKTLFFEYLFIYFID